LQQRIVNLYAAKVDGGDSYGKLHTERLNEGIRISIIMIIWIQFCKIRIRVLEYLKGVKDRKASEESSERDNIMIKLLEQMLQYIMLSGVFPQPASTANLKQNGY
jgi:hypothetical protein